MLNLREVTQKNFRRRLYNFLCLKLRSHRTECHQISTRCTEMIADYCAKSKLRSSNPFRNANVTNEDRRLIAIGSRQKLHVLTA